MITFFSSLLTSNNKGPTYIAEDKINNCQLRKYDSEIVAETLVQSTHQQAGNQAFPILAGYIFGKNEGKKKIQMTAPVTQFEVSPGKYAVQFFMPAQWTLQTLPKPIDSRITLKKVPPRKLVSIKYHGGWSQNLYLSELDKLNEEINKSGIKIKPGAQPIWARYNSPMAPPPIRTNQILYEVQ